MKSYSYPLFSVLIASYNNGKYLQEALNSVLAQTYRNWEVIVVDDCSTDDSLSVLEQYTHESSIKVYTNQENKGCGFTKSRCADLATGELFGYLDPDDSIDSGALEIMVKAHLKYPSHSLIYSTHNICDQELNVLEVSQNIGAIPYNCTSLGYKDKKISHFATFKKYYYNQTEKINPLLRRAVDQDLYYKLEEVGSILFIDKPMYNYRIHTGGISNYDGRGKAVYWNLVVQKEAILRRKKLNFPNDFTIRQLISRYQAFVKVKAYDKINNGEYLKLAYIIFSGLHFFNFHPLAFKLLRYFLPTGKTKGKY